jgi:NAD(P)-dependent dehydrogenase (short-subunit alcohol dehydrogenase family)
MLPETRQALDELTARLVAADAIGQALAHAAAEEPPAWVFVYRHQLEAVREAAEALETALYRSARGDGGHAPHGDSAPAAQGDIRGRDSTLPGSSSRPAQLPSTASE